MNKDKISASAALEINKESLLMYGLLDLLRINTEELKHILRDEFAEMIAYDFKDKDSSDYQFILTITRLEHD